MAGARWDRRELRRMDYATRMEVEKRLAKGDKGLHITRALDLRGPMCVSAVKKNPWPGGLLDKKGALANYEGDWMDEKGVVRPFIGLKDGKVIYAQPVPGAHNPKLRPKADAMMKERAARKAAKEKPKPQTGLLASIGAPDSAPPDALTEDEAEKGDPVGDLIPETESRARSNTIKPGNRVEDSVQKARRFARRALPLKERIQILADLAKLGKSEPRVALQAIGVLNDLDGLTAASKTPAGAGLGTGPLFQLPRDMKMGFAPVEEEEQTEDDSADAPEVPLPALTMPSEGDKS